MNPDSLPATTSFNWNILFSEVKDRMNKERVKGLNEEEINENSKTNHDPACTSCLDSTVYFSSCRVSIVSLIT